MERSDVMSETIRLAISTCPNDTFAFHALMHELVDLRGLQYDIELLDIQQLNDRLFRGESDVIKVSFAAAAMVAANSNGPTPKPRAEPLGNTQ